MLLFILYIGLIALNLYKRKSKAAFLLLLILLWILFGWSYGNADWNIYVNRYNNYVSMSSLTEPLYTLIMALGNMAGLEYRQFLIIMSGICLLLISKTILDYSSEPGLVLALYAIFSFPMDVTQIRFFMASAVVWFGFRWFFKYRTERTKKDLIFWIVSVLIASGIHLLACVTLILLIPLHFKRRITILVTIIANAVLIFASNTATVFVNLVSKYWSDEKASNLSRAINNYTFSTVRVTWFRIAVIFIGFLIIYFAMYQLLVVRKRGKEKKAVTVQQWNQMNFTLDCNIAVLIIVGLATITVDFYRMQQIVVMLNYFAFSSLMLPKSGSKGVVKLQNLIVVVVSVVFAIIALYLLVLRGTNINTVWYPLFQNNVLFN